MVRILKGPLQTREDNLCDYTEYGGAEEYACSGGVIAVDKERERKDRDDQNRAPG